MKKCHQHLFCISIMVILGEFSCAEEIGVKNSDDELAAKISNGNPTKGYIQDGGNLTGFFVSALLEYKQTSEAIKETFLGSGGPFNNATGQKTSGRLSAKTISGGINLGYGYQWLCSYFGLDIDFSIYNLGDHLKINRGSNYDFSNHNTKIKRHYTLDASLRYGFVFGNAMPYLKAGVAFSEWGIKTNYPSLTGLTSLGINQTHHKNKNDVGFLLGAGVDFKQSQHFILGGYVTYRQFNTLKYTHPLIEKVKITPSELSAGLKVSYLF